MAKEDNIKTYQNKVKQHKQNRIFQNKERKFDQKVGDEGPRTNQRLDTKERKLFWCKNENRKTITEMLNI